MAGAGEFPKVTSDIIYAADFNTIRNIAVDVVSTTYGNSISSSAASSGGLIGASAMDLLRGDIDKAYRHITNANSGIPDLNAGTVVSHTHFNAYKTAADYISANRYSVSASQLTLASQTSTLGWGWNGIRVFERQYSWSSAAACTYWFNAGGYFLVGVVGSGSDGSPKANDWQDNILNALPDQTYNRAVRLSTPNVTVTEYGNIAQYTENYCQIVFTSLSASVINVKVILNDADTGDQTGLGAPVDENVNCNVGAAINIFSSFDAITSEVPSVSVISNF
jgi:hypothetical protein